MDATGVFVGRKTELDTVERALVPLRSGRPATVLLAGEAGIGKTSLLEELQRRNPDAHFLTGHCLELTGGETPYAPFVRILRRTLELLRSGSDGPVGATPELSLLIPESGDPSDHGDIAASTIQQGRFFEGVLALLTELCLERPVILAIEDLHWSGSSTRDLLAFLMRNSIDIPLALLLTYRSDELDPAGRRATFVTSAAMRPNATLVELEGLSLDEVRQQMTLLPAEDPARSQEVYQRSGGNPLFVSELIGADLDEIPQTLKALMMARVGRLSSDGLRICRAVAVAGGSCSADLLDGLFQEERTTLNDGLRDCLNLRILVRREERSFAFRHPLLAETVYDDLIFSEKEALHAQIADCLQARGELRDSMIGEIAHHRYRSHSDPDKALAACLEAGKAAFAVHGYPEAVTHLQRAAELDERVRDRSIDRGELHRLLAEALSLSGDGPGAVSAIERAIAAAPSAASPLLYERLGRYSWNVGDKARAVDAYSQAEALAEEAADGSVRARALASQGQMMMLSANYGRAIELCERALSSDGATASTTAHALITLGPARSFRGDLEGGLEALGEGQAVAQANGDAENLGRAFVNRATVLAAGGRYRDSLEVAEAGIEEADRWGLASSFGVWLQFEAAFRAFELGEWDRCSWIADQVLSLNDAGYTAFLHLLRALLHLERGSLTEAGVEIRATDSLGDWGSIESDVPIAVAGARLAQSQGDLAGARERIDHALELVDGTDDKLQRALICWQAASIERGAGPRRTDGERSDRIEGELGIVGDFPLGPARAYVSMARAALATGEESATLWDDAAARWHSMSSPAPHARCLLEAAAARAALRRERTRMAEQLAEAHEIATALDATPLVAACEDLAGRTKVTLTEGLSSADTDPLLRRLTDRETQVLGLLVEGCTNAQIADRLFISVKTASVHVSRILMKLDASNRLEAAAVANRLGVGSLG